MADTVVVIHDVFEGVFPRAKDSVVTVLQLNHNVNVPQGTFLLTESYRKPDSRILSFSTTGTWIVIRGSADDDDASVIEMESQEEVFYFLWIDENRLQKLDATRSEIEPAGCFILNRKIKENKKKIDTLTEREKAMNKLTGTYKGKQSCGDCKLLVATLTLKYRAHSPSGEYLLSEKYAGTKSGDIITERKGKWTVFSKKGEAGGAALFIVLDKQKPGGETWFQLMKDGLQRVDRTLQKINLPGDQVLKKQ